MERTFRAPCGKAVYTKQASPPHGGPGSSGAIGAPAFIKPFSMSTAVSRYFDPALTHIWGIGLTESCVVSPNCTLDFLGASRDMIAYSHQGVTCLPLSFRTRYSSSLPKLLRYPSNVASRDPMRPRIAIGTSTSTCPSMGGGGEGRRRRVGGGRD